MWFIFCTCAWGVAARIILCTANTQTLVYKYISLKISYICALISLLSRWLQSFHQVYARAGRRQVHPLRTSTAVTTLRFCFDSRFKSCFQPSTCVLLLQVGEVINTLCGYNTLNQQVRAAVHLLLPLPRCSVGGAAVSPAHYISAALLQISFIILPPSICQYFNWICMSKLS